MPAAFISDCARTSLAARSAALIGLMPPVMSDKADRSGSAARRIAVVDSNGAAIARLSRSRREGPKADLRGVVDIAGR